MRTLKLACATALAAFALNANAAGAAKTGLGNPPGGYYQPLSNVPGTFTGGIDGLGFHAGGVAACDGCHVMHNANPGPGAADVGAKSTTGLAGEPAWSNHTNAYLLQGSDQSSTCLICHGSSGAQNNLTPWVVADLTPVAANGARWRSPGGDFGWTQVSYGGTVSPGSSHGHNVFAGDWNWGLDARFSVAPGGTWPVGSANNRNTEKFACSSCHDPHGRYRVQVTTGANTTAGQVQFLHPQYNPGTGTKPIVGSGSYGDLPLNGDTAVGVYRLLAGRNYEPASKPGFPFPYDPPVAVAPRDYNRNEDGTEVRVNYATGMSEWCKNCHVEIHSDTNYASGWSGLRHPAASTASLKPAQYNIYNTYVSTAQYATGTSRYTSLVPFERGTGVTFGQLVAGTAATSAIPADGGNVMCLSCHRAHGSAFDSMVRWDQNATFLSGATALAEGIVTRGPAALTAGYYGRGVVATPANGTALGPYQRSLCNKCHGKD